MPLTASELSMPEQPTTEMLELIEILRARWSAEKIPYGPSATEDELAEFEGRYSIRLPDDLRLYFSQLGGMSDWWMGEDSITFFPLRMVKSVAEDLANFGGIPDYRAISQTLDDCPHWFVIADFLITSQVFAIHIAESIHPTPVIVIYGEGDYQVSASSFTAFLSRYLVNSDDVLFPPSLPSDHGMPR